MGGDFSFLHELSKLQFVSWKLVKTAENLTVSRGHTLKIGITKKLKYVHLKVTKYLY
jgi:hypothetical protein